MSTIPTEKTHIRCWHKYEPGYAIENELVTYPDFYGDTSKEGITQSNSGPARMVRVMKCVKCGHSKRL